MNTDRVSLCGGGMTVWMVAMMGILLGQYFLWKDVLAARDALDRLEELEARLEKGWARTRVVLKTLQELRDAVPKRGKAVLVSRMEDGISIAHSALLDAPRRHPSSREGGCGPLSQHLIDGRFCSSVAGLVIFVGGDNLHCELVAARCGCSVMSFDPNPLQSEARRLSIALNEEGWRILMQPSLAYNVTSDADYALRLYKARYEVVHKLLPLEPGEQRWSVPTTRLSLVVRQNVALLFVEITDWRPVLQGLMDFPFRLHGVLLSSWKNKQEDSDWVFLQRFCEVHQLILPPASTLMTAPSGLLLLRGQQYK